MGVEDRDWWREPLAKSSRWPGIVFALILVIGLAMVVHARGWPQSWRVGGEQRGFQPALGLGFGPRKPTYAPGDRWKSYLAPERVCAGGENPSADTDAQVDTMLCLINYARSVAGVPGLPRNERLTRAATLKGEDIVRCRDFNHDACGRDPHAVAVRAGYPDASWGENLLVASGSNGAPRPALDGWLNSEGHRENLLNPAWTEQGVALLTAPRFNGGPDAALWVSEFGGRH